MMHKDADIHTAVNEFYEALNDLFAGNVAPMTEAWSHEDDVTYIGPQGGILIGWDNVLHAWKEQASLKLKGKVEPEDMHVIKHQDLRIAQNFEVGTNIVNGKTEQIRIRATNIFRKEEGKWKLISHQTDLLPFLKGKGHR